MRRNILSILGLMRGYRRLLRKVRSQLNDETKGVHCLTKTEGACEDPGGVLSWQSNGPLSRNLWVRCPPPPLGEFGYPAQLLVNGRASENLAGAIW